MGGFKLGSLFGIPIRVTYSFLFLLLFALLAWGGLKGVVAILLTFAMVLAHELGHALVARKLRVPILGIDLHFFGGAAKLAHMPSSPRQEIMIAAAGPAVSFALGLLSLGLYAVTDLWLLRWITTINFMLGAFNLLPALPMDGGRIFRAALSQRLGRHKATTIAVHVARGVAVLIGVWGLLGLWPLGGTSLFLAGLAVLLWWMAGAELRASRVEYGMGGGPFAGTWGQQQHQGPRVDVLNRDGSQVAGPAAGQYPGRFTVEEQRGPGYHFWVVRAMDGRVLFRTTTPQRW